MMLSLYRRHLKNCPHRDQGRAFTECKKPKCPIWADGQLDGKRFLRSLKTNDWQRALRLAERIERPDSERSDLIPCVQPGCSARVERGRCAEHRNTLAAAIDAFHAANPDLGKGTKRHYKSALRFFLEGTGDVEVHEIGPGSIDAHRARRAIAGLTWSKELTLLRHFLHFCFKRKWTSENAAADIPMPKNLKPTDKEPYSRAEVIRILAACDIMGNYPYERLRARAMILLLRYTALRIGDVAMMSRDRIRHGEIYLRTMKNGKVVKLPVPADLQAALEVLPTPKGSMGESTYFFWNGSNTDRTAIRSAARTLSAVFKASGVPGAHAHRFRHTLATELLESGGTLEDVAEILGNTPDVIRKHYAKWSVARQERISSLMRSVFGRPFDTPVIHEKLQSAN
jgi:integrase